ncbi:MAG: hypothetical protein AABN34_01320 [Acidobacteriota bacterium]
MPEDRPSLRAVIFTHFGNLVYEREFLGQTTPFIDLKDGYIESYAKVLRSYMECNREKKLISIVYTYIDWAVRKSLDDGKPAFKFEARRKREEQKLVAELRKRKGEERKLIAVLREAKTKAEEDLRNEGSRIPLENMPVFRYIGIDDLLELLTHLIQAGEPNLTSFLSGKGQQFTYDSPKFVEAVIRLARGRIPHLAIDPIIRFDEDVEPNARSIELLLQEYQEMERKQPFYFFSGTYGDPDGGDDTINDHAVRTHWFFPAGVKSLKLDLTDETLELIRNEELNLGDDVVETISVSLGIPREQPQQEKLELIKAIKQAYYFLADLSYLGATEVNNSALFYSETLKKLSGRTRAISRPERQVISGAGLIMSNLAVDLLPPFMNFTNQTVWVDDHVKRRLHEALQDISKTHTERVSKARSKQDRHKDGVKDSDMQFARKIYFERLLRGCLLHRIVVDLEGNPTEYSKLIEDIVAYRMKRNDPKLSKRRLGSLRNRLMIQVERHYTLVLRCWSSNEFEGTESFTWAKQLLATGSLNLEEKEKVESYGWVKQRIKDQRINIRKKQLKKEAVRQWLCQSVVQDAMDYIDLVRNWPIFTRAIARLEFSEWWLFK